ncbi:helix-turn-helix transcriptional regulator [Xanthomonas campestris pv. badrii]|uniref:Helix-turn-helix transcriptional regulator n=1 Tax=Xanthomonas campestris pv. badrii TaxID=149696 RepID=A0A7Z2VDE5_XANCA|nr:helix-turn-helix domain-containing protein [Xanthomonas campestris]MCC4605877.1 helix-turn-helix domain-containing protein [Xanthomonas campestris pv. parthenii]QJD69504.1 helix-turn-helix transcriptional regulator [Xanthomonas campestris pv. badrii]
MRITIEQASDIGAYVRAVRKAQGLRQDDLAALAGTSHVVLGNVERGKDTVQLGRVFELLRQLGIQVQLDLPVELSAPVTKLSA